MGEGGKRSDVSKLQIKCCAGLFGCDGVCLQREQPVIGGELQGPCRVFQAHRSVCADLRIGQQARLWSRDYEIVRRCPHGKVATFGAERGVEFANAYATRRLQCIDVEFSIGARRGEGPLPATAERNLLPGKTRAWG